MSEHPRVSCVLPVWNGEDYLADAIRSVLNQTCRDFELIIVDDGSTDATPDIVDRLRREDRRIRLCRQAHAGLVAALNQGMDLALGCYIARMDADDICASERFEVQLGFLDRHQDVGVCGTWVETFDGGRREVIRYPCEDSAIRSRLLFESPLAHPAVMLRREVLERHALTYDATALHAEDYDLWVRAAPHTRFANIPVALVRYRVHPEQAGRRYEEKQDRSARAIRVAQLHDLGIQPTEQEANLHHRLSRWRFDPAPDVLRATRVWLTKLMRANSVAQRYPHREFLAVLGERWASVCAVATGGGISTLAEFWRAPRLARSGFNRRQHLKFAVKCLIRKDPQASFRSVDDAAR
jgi:glycosyltransferase involved in cell wall biosynthesis